MACTLHAMCAQHGDMSSTTPRILSRRYPFCELQVTRTLQRHREERDGNCLQLLLDDSGLSHLRKKRRDAEVRDLSPETYQTPQLSGSWGDSVTSDCYMRESQSASTERHPMPVLGKYYSPFLTSRWYVSEWLRVIPICVWLK